VCTVVDCQSGFDQLATHTVPAYVAARGPHAPHTPTQGKMKPVSASDILRKNAPRETVGSSFVHTNRYDKLRENSPAPSFRSRVDSCTSQKRKVSESDISEVGSKICRLDQEEEEELVILDSKISKVGTLCGKLLTVVQQQQLEVDDPLRAVLADIIEALRTTNEVQGELSGKYKALRIEQVAEQVNPISYSSVVASEYRPALGSKEGKPGNNRKKPSGGLVSSVVDTSGKFVGNYQKVKPQETEDEKKSRRFAEAIKEAERSTLCFNLNLGNIPLMNKHTISEKASLALTRMAAEVEGKSRGVPSPDIIAALDDVTSLVTKMEFYGGSTKEYKGKGVTGFCTVPVKYQFKDKDQKFCAEKKLRDLCKVKCATPYPAIVRECIKQVVDCVRATHPSDFVKVSVVPKDFSLKVARRPPGKDLKWIEYPDLLRLPNEALDVNAKKAPKGLRMFFLPTENCEEMSSPSRPEKPKSPVGRRDSSGK
jgi:hypothetical protein